MSEVTKSTWAKPSFNVYGSVKEITQVQQAKNKSFGGGDDVIVNNQAILAPLGS